MSSLSYEKSEEQLIRAASRLLRQGLSNRERKKKYTARCIFPQVRQNTRINSRCTWKFSLNGPLIFLSLPFFFCCCC